jgi:hypothetical protein
VRWRLTAAQLDALNAAGVKFSVSNPALKAGELLG